MNKCTKQQVNIDRGMNCWLRPFYKNNGITIIALVITIVVMLLLTSVGLSLALGKGGLIEQSIEGRKKAQQSKVYFEARKTVVGLLTNWEAQGLTGEEIDHKINEFFDTQKGQESINEVQKEYGLKTKEEAKELILKDIERSRGRAPMILKVNLKKGLQLPVTQFPDTCFIDWGDGIKSRSLESTQEGIKDIKIYGDFNEAFFGWSFTYLLKKELKDKNQTINIKNKELIHQLLEIKDWGENNFSYITFGNASRLENYVQPRERSFENLKSANSMFANTSITVIKPGLFANAPNLESANSTFDISRSWKEIPEDLFLNCTKLKDVSFCFRSSAGGKIPEKLFASSPELEKAESCFQDCKGLKGSIPENLFANNPKLNRLFLAFDGCTGLTGPLPNNLFNNNPNLNSITGCFSNCSNLTGIGPEYWEYNKNIEYWARIYRGCTNLSNYNQLPEKAKR